MSDQSTLPGYQSPRSGASVDASLALADTAIQADDLAVPTGEGQADGLMTHQDKAKLDGIETGATADQTAQEIATLIDADATAESTLKSALGLGSAAYTASTAYEPADATLLKEADIDDTPADGATTAPISSNWAYDHAADDTAHGNVPAPILTGPALSIPAGVALELTIADYDSYASYSVAAGTGSASMDGDTITYTGAVTGSDTLTITVNDHSRVLTITVLANNLIDAPDPAPAIGAALEGGYYTGAIWDKVCAASGELTIGTGEKTLTIPSGVLPFYYGQQIRIAPGPTNAGQVFMEGTVITRDDTALTVNITSVTGSGTFSTWVVAARWKIIIAPKASGENASVQYKNATTAAPAECFTLTNGPEATAAMIAADTSTVYPLAHWAKSLNDSNGGLGLAGYTDWYVPARDELELVWRNLKPVTNDNYITADRYNAAAYTRDANLDDTVVTHGTNRHSDPVGAAYTAGNPAQTSVAAFQSGGAEAMTFGSVYYWSSSESSATNAWCQVYNASLPGYQDGNGKTYGTRARACRRSIL